MAKHPSSGITASISRLKSLLQRWAQMHPRLEEYRHAIQHRLPHAHQTALRELERLQSRGGSDPPEAERADRLREQLQHLAAAIGEAQRWVQDYDEATTRIPALAQDVAAYAQPQGINPGPLLMLVDSWDSRYWAGAWEVVRRAELAADPPHHDREDDKNYIPAKDCRNDRITTHRQLKALLDWVPDDERGIRRQHRGQHLFVHAGDWHRWNAEQSEQGWEAMDRTAAEVEKTLAEMRAKKDAKKFPKK